VYIVRGVLGVGWNYNLMLIILRVGTYNSSVTGKDDRLRLMLIYDHSSFLWRSCRM